MDKTTGNKPKTTKKSEAYTFDIQDFIIADSWNYQRAGNSFFDKDYIEIIEFFCFHSPCRQGSYSPYSLEDLGWKNQWHSNKFREHLKALAGFDNTNFIVTPNQYEFRDLWEKTEYPDDFTLVRSPFAFLAAAGENNDFMDLLHRIRNGFAHGRYNVIRDHGEYFIYFEDVKSSNGYTYVLARICLTKTILNEWRLFLTMHSPSIKEFGSIIVSSKEPLTV